MTLRQRLDEDLKTAVRAREDLRLQVSRGVKSAVRYREVDAEKAVVLDDAGILQVIGSEIKKRRDAVEQYRAGGRENLAVKEEAEIAVLQGYLPAPLSPEELDRKVDE